MNSLTPSEAAKGSVDMSRFSILIISLFFVSQVSGPAFAAGDENSIKSGVKSVVSDTVSAGKNFFDGIMEGVDEGRKGGEKSPEGPPTVASKDDLTKFLKVEVVKVEEREKGQVEVTVALKNDHDFPVRVTNLGDIRNVVLLDKDGFSYALPNPQEQARDVMALGRSATRVRFVFSGVEARPKVFRFFDTDFNVPGFW